MDNHLILTLGRSGSNFLVDLINQHPNLLNYGEVLGEWMPVRRLQRGVGAFRNEDAAWLDFLLGNAIAFYGAQSIRAANHLRRGRRPTIKSRKTVASLGIKEFSINLQRFRLENYLEERSRIKVISLRRLSVLDRTISYLMLDKTNVVAADKNEKIGKRTPITIEPERFTMAIKVVAEENAALEEMTSALPAERVYRLTYEGMFENPDSLPQWANDLYRFLGADYFEPQIRTRKILSPDPAEVIENFADCRNAAIQAGYGKLLL